MVFIFGLFLGGLATPIFRSCGALVDDVTLLTRFCLVCAVDIMGFVVLGEIGGKGGLRLEVLVFKASGTMRGTSL